MNLPPDLAALVAERQLLDLVRASLSAAQAEIDQAREQAEVTRPPFGGFLTSQKTVEAHREVSRDVAAQTAALHEHLALLEDLEHWLAALLHTAVHDHLWGESAEYRAGHELRILINRWAHETAKADEQFTALVRETRAVAAALSGRAQGSFPDSGPTHEETQTALLRSARNFDRQITEIHSIGASLAAVATGTPFAAISLPSSTEPGHTSWALELTQLPAAAALASAEGALAEFSLLQRARRLAWPAAVQGATDVCLAVEHELLAAHSARLVAESPAPAATAPDAGALLAEIAARRRTRDEQAHQESLTNAPFRFDP